MSVDAQIRVIAKDEASSILKNISQGILQGFGQAAFGAIQNAIGGATQAMAGFVVGSISKASDLNETINKTNIVFEDAAAAMIKWSENSATSLGLSQKSALDAAAGFAVFGKAAGLAGSDVTKFAQEGLARAADIASIFNAKVEDVAVAIQAAFRGETEPIRKYGVMLDDATLRQKALALGIISTTKDALTPQQKTLAANALIMEQTAFTMGDFVNTSDGLANSQRILTAQIENAQTQLGTMFLPIVTKVMGFLNTQGIPILKDVMKAFQDFSGPVLEKAGEVFSNFTALIDEGFTPIGAVIDTLKKFTGIDLDGVATGIGNLAKNAQDLGASIMSQLKPGLDAFANFFTTQGPTIQAIAGVMLAKFAEVSQWFAAEILPFLVAQFNKLGQWFSDNGPLITSFGAKVAMVFGRILETAQVMWVALKPIFDGLINIFLDLVTFVMQLFTGDFAGAFDSLNQIVIDAVDAIMESLSALTDWITSDWFGSDWATVAAQWKSFFDGLGNTIKKWFDATVKGFTKFFDDVKSKLNSWISGIKTAWKTFFDDLERTSKASWDDGIKGWRAFFDGIKALLTKWATDIKTAWDNTLNALKTAFLTISVAIINAVTGWLADIITKITTFATQIKTAWTNAWNALSAAFVTVSASIILAIVTWLADIVARITGFAAQLKTAWDAAWNSLKNTVTTIAANVLASIVTFVNDILAKITAFASNLLTSWKDAWNSLIYAITAVASRIIDTAKTLIQNVIDAVNGKVTGFIDAGKAIVDNIKTGLSNAWDAFINWILGLITALIATVKAALGIGSPSSVFAEMGYNMMTGLAKGITTGAFLPQIALSAVSLRASTMGSAERTYNSPYGMGTRTSTTYQRNNIFGPVTLQMNGGRGAELLKIK